MQHRALAVAAVLVLLVGVNLVTSRRERPWPDWRGALRSSPGSVLVVVVRDPTRVAWVRAAVDEERVVAESQGGFALAEGRIVTESVHHVASLRMQAGWSDARLEVVAIGPRTEEFGAVDAHRLGVLVSKPELEPAEARAALQRL